MLAAIASEMVALALPLTPDAIDIQLAFDVAVQLHPFIVDTSTDRRPPSAPTASALRLSANRHGAPA